MRDNKIMPVTRDVREQIEKSVNQAIIISLQNEEIIKTISKAVSQAVLQTFEKKLNDLEESVAFLKTEINNIKRDNLNKMEQLEEFVADNSRLKSSDLQRLDQIDQVNRSTALRIFNMEEKPSENIKTEIIKLLTTKMEINLKIEDIEKCYRVETKVKQERRGIYVKFSSLPIKQIIYAKKKMLKGTRIVVKEDLTKTRLDLVNQVAEKIGVKNVWTQNGKIFVFVNEKKHLINTFDDLVNLGENC